jgi:hypothetical protein
MSWYTSEKYTALERYIRATMCMTDVWARHAIPNAWFWILTLFFTLTNWVLTFELDLANMLREQERHQKRQVRRQGCLRPGNRPLGDTELLDIYEFCLVDGVVKPVKDEQGGKLLYHRDISPDVTIRNTLYDDRMRGARWKAYARALKEVWGDKPMWWSERATEPDLVEKFIISYLGGKRIRLYAIYEYENRSTGFPYYRFDYEEVK